MRSITEATVFLKSGCNEKPFSKNGNDVTIDNCPAIDYPLHGVSKWKQVLLTKAPPPFLILEKSEEAKIPPWSENRRGETSEITP
jgi:hypothetical protein